MKRTSNTQHAPQTPKIPAAAAAAAAESTGLKVASGVGDIRCAKRVAAVTKKGAAASTRFIAGDA